MTRKSVKCETCGHRRKPTEKHAPAFCQLMAAKREAKGGAKYGNVRTDHAGMSFMSKLESRTYDVMKLREHAGEIRDLRTQVTIRLGRNNRRWVMDFAFICGDRLHYADSKGLETDRWKHLLDLWFDYADGLLEIWKANSRGEPVLTETIHPKGNV